MPGTLYVCATPIGNLGDITLRVLDILRSVNFIAAEDTRHSRKLLEHYAIKTPLISYHQHNERQRTGEIMAKLKEGQNVALISDAGMPGISDPGQILIKACIDEDIGVDVLPGPNAAITALVLSGMPTDSFLYIGFLPVKRGERQKILQNIKEVMSTVIIYEAPHKLSRTLQDIWDILGDRQAAVVRELTKIHQTVYRGRVSELLPKFAVVPKGECCLILAPPPKKQETGSAASWLADLESLEATGMSSKEARKIVSQKYGVAKREIYKAILNKQNMD